MCTESVKVNQPITTLKVFFGDCESLRKSHNLLSTLGFSTVNEINVIKSSVLDFQTSRISSGNLVIEMISDPLFTRIRNSLGKRSSFARVIEMNKSMGPMSRLSSLPLGKSSFFSGSHLLNALANKYPFSVPTCTVDMVTSPETSSSETSSKQIERNDSKLFSNIKEIIIPCSTTKYEAMEEIQSNLLDLFDAKIFNKKLHGIYEIDNSDEKLILRTAPTNVCTIVLKVDDIETASNTLRSLNAIGDCMGMNGTSTHGEIQIKMVGLDEGVEFRITDSNSVSPFYSEPPDSMLADERPEMQSTRVQTLGGGGEREVVPENILVGDCWSEVKVHMTSKKVK